MTDTFTIRTIPLFYELMPDTSVQFEKSLSIWAGSPRLPWNDADTYVELTWFPPVDAVTRKVVKPRQGFDADGLVEYGDVSLTDSVHIKALIRQGGINDFLAWAPIYTADTADGDSLLFPIRIKATKALMEHYPNAPEESCEYVDTVKVRIVKGYRVSGYVSYAGQWAPSTIGDDRSKDAPTYDGDLVVSGIEHFPVGNATIYLKELPSLMVVDSAISSSDGYFSFPGYYIRGSYLITGRSPRKTSTYGEFGLNGNDATWVQNYVALSIDDQFLPEKTNPQLSMWWWASNVDLSDDPVATKGLDGNDATAIQNKVAQRLSYGNRFQSLSTSEILDDWAYSVDSLELDRDTMFHVRAVMRGDADRNYNDKSEGGMMMKALARTRLGIDRKGQMEVRNTDRVVNYPVLSTDSGFMAGFQIFLFYNESKVEPLSVSLPSGLDPERTNLEYNVIGDQILTTWVTSSRPYFHEGDTLLMLRLKLKGQPKKNFSSYFKNNALQYVVSDTSAKIIPWKIHMPDLDVDRAPVFDTVIWKPAVEEGDTVYSLPDNEHPLVTNGMPEEDPSHILNVVPNPISTWGDVTYFVSGNCLVNLKLYSLLGENVLTFVEGERQQGMYRLSMDMQTLPSGVYVLRLETSRDGQTEFDIVKIIIKR